MTHLRQRGAALLAAMMTVALVATFSAAALWQQWRSVEIEAADRARVQAAWILTGALDWARLILREDARASGGSDHLAEPWAVPLQEARLSTFLAADASNTDANEGDRTFLSGEITDLQSLLNVNNLVEAGSLSASATRSFERLFEVLGLPRQQLAKMAENLRFASSISAENLSAGQAPLVPQRVEQLVWLGLSPEAATLLLPYVTVLPQRTAINLNTAPAEVIYAVGENLSLADAQRLVAERQRQHFRTVQDAQAFLPESARFADGTVAVRSSFFGIRGRLRVDDVVIEQRSVVRRNGLVVETIQREHGTLQPEPVPPPQR